MNKHNMHRKLRILVVRIFYLVNLLQEVDIFKLWILVWNSQRENVKSDGFSHFPSFYKETSGFTATTQAPEGMSTATPSLSSRETSTDITTTKERGGKGQKKQLEEKGSILVGFKCVLPMVDHMSVP